MTFKRYMEVVGLTDLDMTRLIGRGCTERAVMSYRLGERIPRPDRMLLIQEITGGRVTLRDWLKEEAA